MESEPDNQTLLLVARTAAEETAKLYGTLFSRMVSAYALKFEAEKLNEKPPENLHGLEEVTNYIIANLGKYPRGYNSLIYGIAKADIKFWGSTGAGSRKAAYSAIKAIFENSGILKGVIGATKDLFEAVYITEKINKETKTASNVRYVRGNENQVIAIIVAVTLVIIIVFLRKRKQPVMARAEFPPPPSPP
ncbi:MAG: hypothetical protein QXO71_12290, partial [Candidatus Jordarchaeaceae archaeon]